MYFVKLVINMTRSLKVVVVVATFVLVLSLELVNVSSCNSFIKTINYLQTYGFLDDIDENNNLSLQNASSPQYIFALKTFQDYYGLPVNNSVNEETKKLIATPRCGVKDIPSYGFKGAKWNTNVITWNVVGAASKTMRCVEAAFQLWERYGNIRLQHSFVNPNILISFVKRSHTKHTTLEKCHAFYPTTNQKPTEIHLNADIDWDEEIENIAATDGAKRHSLFIVLAHEIGHALGIDHSRDRNALMFAYYSEPKSAFNANQYMLSFDDQLAIENLYGKKKNDEIIEFPTTIVEGSSSSSSSTNPTVKDKLVARSKTITLPDLCKIEQKLDTFLIVNRKIYVFYNKYVWFMELDDRMYRDPLIITDWLNFLPKDFKRIDAVYQRPNGEIVFFINDQIFIMSYPSFKLVKEYSISKLIANRKISIQGALHSYTGHTYIFYDKFYFAEVSECDYKVIKHGLIGNEFVSLPSDFSSYNEFTNALIKTGKNKLEVFNIICPNRSILEQLRDLLARLISVENGNYKKNNNINDKK
ncbi:hypothetical protein RN001_008988 [Aquatica leii]|uniref:Peptidase metallopeptidase domain-containing protein n=1 Tax=Aquatica leii TaxID=1421715 RepID=A0AAN7PAB2_9COLE|nr:hypothetical protein RN001_008988 [Aquatica leii]